MIGILLLATRKYKQFVQPLIVSIDEHIAGDKMIFVFGDEEMELSSVSAITQIQIPPYNFPEATLFRYAIFNQHTEHLRGCSHLLYMDVDMKVVGEINDEILSDGLLAVRHPGFYRGGWGSTNNPKESLSYLPQELQYDYYCGGVQGGEAKTYLAACKVLSDRILQDEFSGARAIFHDETHWNWLLKQDIFPHKSLDPSYCMVEEEHRRKLWGIDHLQPKIIALTKNHEEIRA